MATACGHRNKVQEPTRSPRSYKIKGKISIDSVGHSIAENAYSCRPNCLDFLLGTRRWTTLDRITHGNHPRSTSVARIFQCLTCRTSYNKCDTQSATKRASRISDLQTRFQGTFGTLWPGPLEPPRSARREFQQSVMILVPIKLLKKLGTLLDFDVRTEVEASESGG